MLAKLKEQVQGLLVEEGSSLRIASLELKKRKQESRGVSFIIISCDL